MQKQAFNLSNYHIKIGSYFLDTLFGNKSFIKKIPN